MVVDTVRRPGAAAGARLDPPPAAELSRPARRRVSRLVRLLPAADFRQVYVGFRRGLRATPAIESHLAGAIGDLLGAPGSLVRAQLAWGVGRALGLEPAAARSAAVAVEYLHTASLVFDDLPAMDDARERRGRPCPHVLYGEGAAILAGLALVHRAHALVAEAAAGLPAARERKAWLRLEQNVGLGGILDGQARDLHFRAGGDPRAVAAGKTTPLLRLALLLPAALAGADAGIAAALDRLAEAWGFAYQALDDFRDLAQSAGESGKTARRDQRLGRPNLVASEGPERAFAVLERELATADDQILALARAGDLAATLARFTHLLEGESERIAGRFAAGG
jgi:geranylgeranyl diphosphate synthase type II